MSKTTSFLILALSTVVGFVLGQYVQIQAINIDGMLTATKELSAQSYLRGCVEVSNDGTCREKAQKHYKDISDILDWRGNVSSLR